MALPAVPQVRVSRFTQAMEFYRRPLEFLERCKREHGDFFVLWPPGFPTPVTFIGDPDAIKEIFAADGTDLIESGSIAAPMMESVIGQHSMLILDGAKHRRHRGLIMPFFARAQFARFGDEILRLVDERIDTWPIGRQFPVRDETRRITLEVILRIIFGGIGLQTIDSGLLRDFFSRTPSPLIFLRWLQKDLGPFSPWGRFLRLRDQLYGIITAEMEQRRAQPAAADGDILSALMEARDERGGAMETQEILDEIFTLIGAGNDTTATALSWAIYHIWSDPDVLNRLRQELAPAANMESAASFMVGLPYLEATVKEVLRISPIFPLVLRRLNQPMQLGRYDVPAGSLVAPSIYLVHYRSDIWKNPERFNPDRFLDARYPSNHFLPFGGGVRHCIGAALATYEMKLILGRIVVRTELKLRSGYVPRPRWRVNFLGPSEDVPVTVLARTGTSETSAAI